LQELERLKLKPLGHVKHGDVLPAAEESRLPLATFPDACPWTLDRLLDEDFLPPTAE
jgi:hypothetical protein